MIVYVTSVISVILLAVACYQAFKETSVPDEPKDRMPAILLVAVSLTMTVGCVLGEISVHMLMVDLIPASAGMYMLQASFGDRRKVRPYVVAMSAMYVILLMFHIAVGLGWLKSLSVSVLLAVYLAWVIMLSGFFLFRLIFRLKNLKAILKTGTIWANVQLAVDASYIVMILIVSASYLGASSVCPCGLIDCLLIFPVLAALMLAAMGIRTADGVLFIFWRDQERRIVESMKVNKVETAVDPAAIEDVYQEIYERVVAYFEEEKPFLDNELTINDLVKVLYSNKLYISRAISQFTGRNFCQFVNYYRVIYSMELFRNNHNLKIHDLASNSGFNSDVSYNMAFRLFMGETPGEWCRKERNRKIKMKK